MIDRSDITTVRPISCLGVANGVTLLFGINSNYVFSAANRSVTPSASSTATLAPVHLSVGNNDPGYCDKMPEYCLFGSLTNGVFDNKLIWNKTGYNMAASTASSTNVDGVSFFIGNSKSKTTTSTTQFSSKTIQLFRGFFGAATT